MKRKKIVPIIICTAAFMTIPCISAFAMDGWQQDAAQEWIYKENDRKLVNQWIPWVDGTLRYVGGNGQIIKNNWVNSGDGRYRLKRMVQDMRTNGSAPPPIPHCLPQSR